MTYINSNDHNMFILHEFWKLNSDRLSSNFTVNLLQDIGGNRQVHLHDCLFDNTLRHDIVFSQTYLHFWVVSCVT